MRSSSLLLASCTLLLCLGNHARADGPLGGRAYAWDSVGLAPFDIERPLTDEEKETLRIVKSGELAQAEAKSWKTIYSGKKSFLSAWVLVQCARTKNTYPILYQVVRKLEKDKVAPQISAYLRYETSRLVNLNYHPRTVSNLDPEKIRLLDDLKQERDRCRRYSDENLPIAIAIHNYFGYWILFDREVYEAYRKAHPKGPDIRPLLCSTYNSGRLVGSESRKAGRPVLKGEDPQEPQPLKVIALAEEMLHENPKRVVAHYFLAKAYYYIHQDQKAIAEMKIVANDPNSLEWYRVVARRFLARPDGRAFNVAIVN